MKEFLSFDTSELNTGKLHSYLLGMVAPRPIAFASTLDSAGNPNLAPFSYFNVFSSAPPILIFSPARRVRDNTTKHTLQNLLEVPEVVINVVSHAIVEQVNLASTEYPREINEFNSAGFTPLKSDLVKPFRVAESPAQMECRVIEIKPLSNKGGAGNLIICEVLKFHIQKDILDENGSIDPQKIDLVARMGQDFYARASGISIFEVTKPVGHSNLGFEGIPEKIRTSKVLTGNDLGKLGMVQNLPSDEEVKQFTESWNGDLGSPKSDEDFHRLAQQYLENNDSHSAWKILLSKNIK